MNTHSVRHGLCALAVLMAATAYAGSAETSLAPSIITRGQIAHAFSAPHRPGHTAQAIAPPDAFRYWAVTRRAPGSVEIHEKWVDVIYVRAGAAHLQTGTDVKGDWRTGDGEWRGGRILHPRLSGLKTGDMVVIPAGLAHRFIPLNGKPFEYVTIKVPAAHPGSAAVQHSGR